MIIFSPAVMLEEFAAVSYDIRDGATKSLAKARLEGKDIYLDPGTLRSIRSAPVYNAVMEKTKRADVAPCDIGWADVGSWAELWRLSEKDTKGNVVSGSATLLDGMNNLVRGEGIQVSAVGVSDLVIVATPEAVLIVPRARAQDVKLVAPKKN
jgi:mannose-1-phosphate guanylyltransferase